MDEREPEYVDDVEQPLDVVEDKIEESADTPADDAGESVDEAEKPVDASEDETEKSADVTEEKAEKEKPAKKKPARKRKPKSAKKTKKKTTKKSTKRTAKGAAKKPAKKTKKPKKAVKVKVNEQTIWIVGLIAVIIIGAFLFKGGQPETPTPTTTTITGPAITPTPAGKVRLEFYVMSQCPYGTQVEDGIKPVLDKLGDAVDFHLDFIVNENADGSFKSLHGQTEVDGNIVQLCAAKYNPTEYMSMVTCMNKEYRSIPGNWEACATENNLDVSKIKSCYEGREGKTLLSESAKRANAVGATGSPTMYLDGKPYRGGRDSLSFTRAICAQLDGHPACEGMPACAQDTDCPEKTGKIAKCENPGEENAACSYVDPVKVDLIVLNDKECASCDTSQILKSSLGLFPGVVVRDVDVGTEEGKKLVVELGITKAPSYLFAESVTETNTWATNAQMKSFFEKTGDYYKLKDQVTGATYFVNEDARQAYYDTIGLTPGDNKPQIDFFVMSYCPYGNQAEELVKDVYDSLGDKIEYKPHYVIYSNYSGGGPNYCLDEESLYCSMHGIQELNQGIREYCVNKYMGIGAYFDFVLPMNKKCNSRNADACWEDVAKEVGLDTQKIKDCEKNEGLEIAAAEKKLGDMLGVRGSPTIFIEGDKYSGARTAAGYQAALCGKFDEKPAECANVIESSAPAAPAGGCG